MHMKYSMHQLQAQAGTQEGTLYTTRPACARAHTLKERAVTAADIQ